MKYAALSPDQIYRLNQCAPAVMEIISDFWEFLMRERYYKSAEIIQKISDYIMQGGKIPDCLIDTNLRMENKS